MGREIVPRQDGLYVAEEGRVDDGHPRHTNTHSDYVCRREQFVVLQEKHVLNTSSILLLMFFKKFIDPCYELNDFVVG
jgi:hypothetical protein